MTALGLGVALMAFSQSPWLGLALAMLLLVGFCNTFYLTQVSTFLQQHVPDHLRGRVMSIYSLCWNLLPLGGLIGGPRRRGRRPLRRPRRRRARRRQRRGASHLAAAARDPLTGAAATGTA